MRERRDVSGAVRLVVDGGSGLRRGEGGRVRGGAGGRGGGAVAAGLGRVRGRAEAGVEGRGPGRLGDVGARDVHRLGVILEEGGQRGAGLGGLLDRGAGLAGAGLLGGEGLRAVDGQVDGGLGGVVRLPGLPAGAAERGGLRGDLGRDLHTTVDAVLRRGRIGTAGRIRGGIAVGEGGVHGLGVVGIATGCREGDEGGDDEDAHWGLHKAWALGREGFAIGFVLAYERAVVNVLYFSHV